MIPTIEGDQTGRPWVEFGGDGIYRIYFSECAFALPLWDMSDVDHVRCFDLEWKFLLSPRIRLTRFVLVFALRTLPFVFGVEFAGLLEDATFSVGRLAGLSGVSWIWQGLSSILSRLDGPSLLPLNGFFH